MEHKSHNNNCNSTANDNGILMRYRYTVYIMNTTINDKESTVLRFGTAEPTEIILAEPQVIIIIIRETH